MTPNNSIFQRFAGFGARLGLTSVICAYAAVTFAGQIESLSWQGQDPSIFEIRVQGNAPYRVQSLEAGRRLRLSFPGSTMGPQLGELAGQDQVKGVYPYLAENGTAVNLDVLVSETSQLEVQQELFGYRIAVVTGEDASASNTAPAAESLNVTADARASNAAVNGGNSLNEILYAKLPGDRVQITLKMAQPPGDPNSFAISNPARIALDFAGVAVNTPSRVVQVKEGALTSIMAIEADGRTRVVLSLIKSVGYATAVRGNDFVITLDSPVSPIASTAKPRTTRFTSGRRAGKYSLKGIDFRRGAGGDARIIIGLSDPSVGVDIREQTGEIILDFLNTSISGELQRRLDVVDFATPVQTIDTFAVGRNTRMIITPKGKYEHIAYQTGDVLTVSVKPIIEKPDEKKVDEFGYSGEKLSLNFQNIDVRAALQVLADFTDLNFVVSDTVSGNLTLRLKDVPWDQALDLIVDAKNLAVRKKGNVVTVAPAAEVAAKEKAALEATKSVIELEPLVSELIQINYAKADDIANLLKSIRALGTTVQENPVFGTGATATAAQSQSSSNTLLSPRGQVTVDARTNSVLIQDTPGKIREVRKLIASLDQPVRQVMVETRLVEATDNYAKSLGVRFGHVADRIKGGTLQRTTGSLEALEPLSATPSVFEIPSGLNVNLPSGGVGGSPAGVLTLSLTAAGKLLDLELSALEQEGKGKIISSPRVITANQKKATIEQGQEQVLTQNILGVGSVVTKKATLKLEVTPQITPDDRINLEVDITKDNFVTTGQNPTLNVKQVKTQVLLDNGETVVIGGIYEQDRNNSVTQVPFFGDLPLLGWLFKNKEFRDNKTELLIFVTPRILSENVSLR
jgi:type IV pilus assembly protein PilQ